MIFNGEKIVGSKNLLPSSSSRNSLYHLENRIFSRFILLAIDIAWLLSLGCNFPRANNRILVPISYSPEVSLLPLGLYLQEIKSWKILFCLFPQEKKAIKNKTVSSWRHNFLFLESIRRRDQASDSEEVVSVRPIQLKIICLGR